MAIKDIKINGKTIKEIVIDGNTFAGGGAGISGAVGQISQHIRDTATWSNKGQAKQDYLAKISGTEYTEAESTSGNALSVLTEYKKETISSDFSDGVEALIEEMRSPYIKHISSSATDRVKWTKIYFPNLETCTRNINYGNLLTDVTIPEKFNTPAQLTTLFGSAANIAKITFHWIDSNGDVTFDEEVAAIDPNEDIDGIPVTYSKVSGIANYEKIDVELDYDSKSDAVNNGIVKINMASFVVTNPSVQITDDEITNYVRDNTVFTNDIGTIDLLSWPFGGTTLYTAHPNSITKGDDFIYIVRADTGFTVNGSTQYSVTYNIPNIPDIYWTSHDSTSKTFNTYKNDKLLFSNTDGTSQFALIVKNNKDVWTRGSYYVYKNNVKLNYSYGSISDMCVDKDDSLYVYTGGYDGNISKDGVRVGKVGNNGYSLITDKDGSWYATSMETGGNIYKDQALLYSLLISNPQITIDNNNVVYATDGKEVYKGETLIWTDPDDTVTPSPTTSRIFVDDHGSWFLSQNNGKAYKDGVLLYTLPKNASDASLSQSGQLISITEDKIYVDGVETFDTHGEWGTVMAGDEKGGKTGIW